MRGALGLCVLSGLSALMLSACVGAPETGVDESGQGNSLQGDIAPTGISTVRDEASPDSFAPTGQAVKAAIVKINYHGGPVMLGTINAYVIWYGNWSGNTGTTIIPAFLSSLGGSPYFNINTTYYNSSNTHISNSVHYGGSTTDNYSLGTQLGDADIGTIVQTAINRGKLPKDTNGVYFVLTSADVNETSGFCTQYCGWHTNDTGILPGSDIKYSFVGNAAACLSACAAQSNGPNNNGGVDGMVSVIAHELEESATDPDLNAWYDVNGAENGDKCAWTFGTESTASNGTKYNVTLGGKQYLIQRNWVVNTGCAMSH